MLTCRGFFKITAVARRMFSEIVILVILSAIIVSLFSGMYFLLRDRGRSTRMVKALTVRIALSLILFALLMLGYWAGWLHPHGLLPPRH
ncbi:MAG TPA: twin transmembrane helix small protein [Gammaproteobacteria bacterium]|nr:twin transmembrane helix small protein [Gammaproteobacteria bacterium]